MKLQPSKDLQSTFTKADLQPSPGHVDNGRLVKVIETKAEKECFYRLADVQKLLGVSRTTLWRWTAENGLKVVRIGGVSRIRESDLQAFLNRHETSEAGSVAAQGESPAIDASHDSISECTTHHFREHRL